MKWSEFVELVEDKLIEEGMDRDTEISWIDMGCGEVEVGVRDNKLEIFQ